MLCLKVIPVLLAVSEYARVLLCFYILVGKVRILKIQFCFLGNLGKNRGKITAFYPFIRAVDWWASLVECCLILILLLIMSAFVIRCFLVKGDVSVDTVFDCSVLSGFSNWPKWPTQRERGGAPATCSLGLLENMVSRATLLLFYYLCVAVHIMCS